MTNNDEGSVAVIAQAVEELKTRLVRDAEFEGAFTFGKPIPQTWKSCLELLEAIHQRVAMRGLTRTSQILDLIPDFLACTNYVFEIWTIHYVGLDPAPATSAV